MKASNWFTNCGNMLIHILNQILPKRILPELNYATITNINEWYSKHLLVEIINKLFKYLIKSCGCSHSRCGLVIRIFVNAIPAAQNLTIMVFFHFRKRAGSNTFGGKFLNANECAISSPMLSKCSA